MQDEIFILVDKAVEGDKKALEELILSVQDMIFNLSLRMLGMPCDAEDIKRGFVQCTSDIMQNIDENILTEELKQSCTNVMLQCLEPESRVIYVLGIMFKLDSKICGEILDITPEAYRQRLSRIRKKVGRFLSEYCELSGTGKCSCQKRIGYAIQTHRLNPSNLEFNNLAKLDSEIVTQYTQSMEAIDRMSLIFAGLPQYGSPESIRNFVGMILNSENMKIIKGESI